MATHSRIAAWESHGQRSLAGYSPQGCKESDTTERLSPAHWLSLGWGPADGKTRQQHVVRCLR